MDSKIACLAILCMAIVLAPHATDALTCGQVSSSLAPCLPFLKSGGPVQPKCCGGVKSLSSAARTTQDRQAACKCLKSLASSTSFNSGNAASLPGKCGVSIPYKISASVDCNKVK